MIKGLERLFNIKRQLQPAEKTLLPNAKISRLLHKIMPNPLSQRGGKYYRSTMGSAEFGVEKDEVVCFVGVRKNSEEGVLECDPWWTDLVAVRVVGEDGTAKTRKYLPVGTLEDYGRGGSWRDDEWQELPNPVRPNHKEVRCVRIIGCAGRRFFSED